MEYKIKKVRMFLFAIGASVFCCGCLLMILEALNERFVLTKIKLLAVGIGGGVFFFIVLIIVSRSLFDARPVLYITENGILDRRYWTKMIPWSDIKQIYTRIEQAKGIKVGSSFIIETHEGVDNNIYTGGGFKKILIFINSVFITKGFGRLIFFCVAFSSFFVT